MPGDPEKLANLVCPSRHAVTKLSESALLQLSQAARGCVSGTLREWPLLKSALEDCGVKVFGDEPALTLRELSILCLEIYVLRLTLNQLGREIFKGYLQEKGMLDEHQESAGDAGPPAG